MLEIREEHYCKGCYHYYFNYKNTAFYTNNYCYTFTAVWCSRAWARRKLRERYPFLNDLKIRYV